MSCDLKPTQVDGPHYEGDVFDLDWMEFDLVILHPVCTKIANSGSKHLYIDGNSINGRDEQRWQEMREGAEFFKRCFAWNAPRVACENPKMLGYAMDIIGGRPSQYIHPWQHGHPEQKETGLWLRGLPLITETNNVYEYMMTLPRKERERIHFMSPGKDRGALRSETYPGIAEAFADQWGALLPA